jgi:hypothetical protein
MPKSIWEMELKDLVSATLDKVESGITKTFGKIQMLDNKLKEMESHKGGEGIIGEIGKAAAGLFAVEKVAEFGKEVLHTGTMLENYETKFENLTGSVNTGKEAFEQLEAQNKKITLPTDSIMAAGEALEKVGYPVEALGAKIHQLGELSDGNGEKLNQLAFAYSRMVATGKIEPRMLKEFPELFQEVGKIANRTGRDLQKAMMDGELPMKIVDQALNNLTASGARFGNMLESAASTTEGKWLIMGKRIEEDEKKIYHGLQPFIMKLFDLAEVYLPKVEHALKIVWNAARNSDMLIIAFDAIKIAVKGAIAIVSWLFNFFKEHQTILEITKILFFGVATGVIALSIATGVLSAGVSILSAILAVTPIGWVIAGIAAITGAVIYCWKHFEGFRKFLYSLWESIKVIFSGIASAIWNEMKGIAKLWAGIFTLNPDMIKEGLGDLKNSLGAVVSMPGKVADAWKLGGEKEEAATAAKQQGKEVGSEAGIEQKKGYGKGTPGTTPIGDEGELGGGGTGGESKIRNVIVTIQGGLVHELHIHAANVKESVSEIKETVARTLVGAVRDSEIALGSN